jgi:hypothetical protein
MRRGEHGDPFCDLLGPLPYLMDLVTRFRSRTAVLQFVRCERGDTPFLIGSHLIRKCTGVKMKADNVHFLVDGVRAVVSDRFNNKAVFLGLRHAPVIRRDSSIVGAGHHEKKTTVCVEDVDTVRMGTKLFQLAAIRAHLIR